MGDRVAEYLSVVIMLVAVVATIALGAAVMGLTKKMFYNFSDSTKDKTSDCILADGVASPEPDERYASHEDKIKQALSMFEKNLGKACKITVKRNNYYPDYFDIWIHDADCQAANHYHDGLCKWCTEHPDGFGTSMRDCTYIYRK